MLGKPLMGLLLATGDHRMKRDVAASGEAVCHDRHGVLSLFGRELQAMPPARQELWLRRAQRYWRGRGFPYPELSPAEAAREFRLLQGIEPESILRDGEARCSMVGLRLANSFHPQMWSVREHGRSAVECFEDNTVLRRALAKSARFWPNRRCWNAQCLRSVLRIYHRARVSNFRPTVARAAIARFSRAGDTILDFSAGYGGRLLGALSLGRRYIGIDPAAEQVAGLRLMAAALGPLSGGAADIHQACAEELLPELPRGNVDLVFSSPPYFDRERYSSDESQSFRRYPTYSQWKKGFLAVVIRESCRVLRRGGYFLLNVADVEPNTVATDAAGLASERFAALPVIRMLTSAMPSLRARRRIYKWEPILVFRKR